MAVNYMGVVNALAPVIRSMVARKTGHIAITSSVAGWRGLPKSAAYGPTKAALISLAESLYFDLTPKGIKVQVICPGFVESEATAVNDFDMPHLISASRAATYILDGLGSSDFSIEFQGPLPVAWVCFAGSGSSLFPARRSANRCSVTVLPFEQTEESSNAIA